MTNEAERKWRIESSQEIFLSSTDDKKVIVKLMAKWGISRRKAKEYLDVLKELNILSKKNIRNHLLFFSKHLLFSKDISFEPFNHYIFTNFCYIMF